MAMNLPEASSFLTYYSGGRDFMSPEDQRAQKAAILLAHQETEDQIKALVVQAQRLGEHIETFGRHLRMVPAQNIMREGQEDHNIAQGPTPPEVVKAMSGWEKSFEIADRLRQAMSRLEHLDQQKVQLGLR